MTSEPVRDPPADHLVPLSSRALAVVDIVLTSRLLKAA
jgi:hypothetical protein